MELVETIKQQISTLNKQQRAELSQFLEEQAKQDMASGASSGLLPPKLLPVDSEAAEKRRRQHTEWMRSHREEYGGMYVALDGDRLLGTGRNYPEAAAAARQSGVDDAYVEFVLPPDYEGYMAG